ncbi:unnamed protein product [Allacma fusca]|uniref:DUF2236 domain-containing protein n=1 Tax=Allacma fusca TaxID=39272 RepID=A0A8J2LUR5_9HEXA|nr:unnamed protein product [Allacma fusca]
METIQEEMQHVEVCKGSEHLHGDMSQVPLSQYNMTITQFCFVGFLVLMPKSFGILDDTGIQGFVHNWAVFGRLLGIEDRHNLAIHFLTMNQECKRKVFVTIFEKIFLPNLKNLDVTTMYVWDGLVKGFRPYIKGMRLKAMVYYLMVYGADVKEPLKLRGLMSWKDKLSFEYFKFCTNSLSKSQLGRGLRNNGVRFGIFKAERRYLPKWKKEDSNHK